MMILHGGRLSPFVRRVELWLVAQERTFERNYVSVFDPDFGGLMAINPLGRVPVLVLDDGTSLFETSAILDYLDDTAPAGRRLVPASGAERWQSLQALALAHGTAEKVVALIYERLRRPKVLQWPEWKDRIKTQIRSGLIGLNTLVGPDLTPLGALGLSAVCAYDLAATKFPALTNEGLESLAGLSARANALPAFATTHPSLA
jgi:glutathione S-transferase